jgi:hypothetical protein
MAMAVPQTDAKLAEYSTNFQTRGTATPLVFSLTALQMTQYTTLHDAFISANNACKAEGARSKALCMAKDDAKVALLAYARELYGIIQASPTVTNENKTLIGVTVRDTVPSNDPPPALSPLVSNVSVTGSVGRYKIADRAFPNTRRKPANAIGATIMSATGPTPPPAGSTGWKVEGQTGRNTFLVDFGDVAPGTPCWVTAVWYNRRGEYSPACPAVLTYLQTGPMAEAA